MKYFAIACLVTVLASCSAINAKLGLADDHFAEELAEEAIEMKTGLDVDLTPGTTE